MKQIGLRVSDELAEWIRQQVFDARITLNAFVVALIEGERRKQAKRKGEAK
jgi:hypothetical protein